MQAALYGEHPFTVSSSLLGNVSNTVGQIFFRGAT